MNLIYISYMYSQVHKYLNSYTNFVIFSSIHHHSGYEMKQFV